MKSRRELFTWAFAGPAAPERAAPERAAPERPESGRPVIPPPVIPPEIAARAARFRAEREARASTTLPAGRIMWLEDAEAVPIPEEPPPIP